MPDTDGVLTPLSSTPAEPASMPFRMGASIHVLGHGVMILGGFLYVIFEVKSAAYLAQSGIATQIVGSLILAITSPTLRVRQLLPFLSLLGYIGILAILGYGMENSLSYWEVDVLGFGLFANAFAGAIPAVQKRVYALYAWIIPTSAVLALYVLSLVKPASVGQRLVVEGETEVSFSTMRELCLPAGFLLLQSQLSTTRRYIAYVLLFSQLTFGLFTATRGDVMMPAMTTLAMLMTSVGARNRRLQLMAVLCIALVALTLAFGESKIIGAFSNLGARLGESKADMVRASETEYFLAQTHGALLIFGRGLGGSYHGLIPIDNPYGFSMVHFGPAHLILKGGIVLLVLVSIVVVVMLVGSVLRNRSLNGNCWFVLIFLLSCVGHTQFLSGIYMALFSFALGSASTSAPDATVGAVT